MSSTRSRYLKTWFFYTQPLAFLRLLITEIISQATSANKQRRGYYLRLNGMSDIEWERFIYMDELVKRTPGLRGFYDYTKHPKKNRIDVAARIPGGVPFPQKYRLIFSWDEKKATPNRARDWLLYGGSLNVVYPHSQKSDVQKMIRGNRKMMLDGDTNDNGYKYPHHSIIFVRNKGKLKETSSQQQKTLLTPLPIVQKLVDSLKRYRKAIKK